MGLYCLNTTRFLLGEEPTEVSAQVFSTSGDARFREIEESVSFTLRFPSGVLARCMTGYGAFNNKIYTVFAETDGVRIDPAFPYRVLRQERIHAPRRPAGDGAAQQPRKGPFCPPVASGKSSRATSGWNTRAAPRGGAVSGHTHAPVAGPEPQPLVESAD